MHPLRAVAMPVAIAALAAAGCMQVPAYRDPAGYSSTYHRHLKQARQGVQAEFAPSPRPTIEGLAVPAAPAATD